jgi:uncharacterized membrane protein (UPF0127 family)
MNKKNLTSFIIVFIFIALMSFVLINQPPKNFGPADIKYVKIAGQDIKVDLALTVAEQEQGLSGRSGLAENSGMLFVFSKPGQYLFWMKDMNFPIDIIWLGEDMRVIYIKKDARPELYPETYGPNQNAKYVLEIASGFSEQYGLKAGDSALFTY